jgi:hypothetical protein
MVKQKIPEIRFGDFFSRILRWCHQKSNDSDNTQYIKILFARLRKSPTHFSSPFCTASQNFTLLVQLLRKGSKILHITETMRLIYLASNNNSKNILPRSVSWNFCAG